MASTDHRPKRGAYFLRVLVDRNIRPILEPADHWRAVQLLAPTSPEILADIFDLTAGVRVGNLVIDSADKVARWYGRNRSYKLAPVYPIANKFKVAPGSCIVGATTTEYAILQVIVERMEPPPGELE